MGVKLGDKLGVRLGENEIKTIVNYPDGSYSIDGNLYTDQTTEKCQNAACLKGWAPGTETNCSTEDFPGCEFAKFNNEPMCQRCHDTGSYVVKTMVESGDIVDIDTIPCTCHPASTVSEEE